MGDGRYYTFRQFFQILYLTGMAGFLVYTILFMMLRSRIKNRIHMIVRSLYFLLALIFVGFIKELVYEIEAYVILTYISMFLILILMISWILHYFKRKKVIYFLSGVYILLLGTNYIDSISYVSVHYSTTYRLTIIGFVTVIIILLIHDITQNYYEKNPEYNGSNTDTSLIRYKYYESLYSGMSIGIMSTTYLIKVVAGLEFPIHEIGCFVGIFLLNVVFLRFMPEEKIPAGYRHLVENFVDTIITLNNDKKVLGVNNTPLKPIIKEGIVDFENPSSFFIGEVKSYKEISKKVKEVVIDSGEQHITVRYSYNEIIKQKKSLGFVLVIEDYTKHEDMLVELERKKEELVMIKQDLLRYSRTTKILSAEKERNRLLIEVQNDLGHQLAELSKYILNTKELAYDLSKEKISVEELSQNISQGIQMAKKNLTNIRKTVRQYRSSYEDGNRM